MPPSSSEGKTAQTPTSSSAFASRPSATRAYFIQSEENIRSRDDVQHYVFPVAGLNHAGRMERRRFPAGKDPLRVLITGGASCPDGLIQQVISRINALFPVDRVRAIEDVLAACRARVLPG